MKILIQYWVDEEQYEQIIENAKLAGITRRNGGANIANLMRGLLAGEVYVFGSHDTAKFRIAPVNIPPVWGGRRKQEEAEEKLAAWEAAKK